AARRSPSFVCCTWSSASVAPSSAAVGPASAPRAARPGVERKALPKPTRAATRAATGRRIQVFMRCLRRSARRERGEDDGDPERPSELEAEARGRARVAVELGADAVAARAQADGLEAAARVGEGHAREAVLRALLVAEEDGGVLERLPVIVRD